MNKEEFGNLLTDILYYIPNSKIKRPKIYTLDETCRLLKRTKLSLTRLGDGEYSIINGGCAIFQRYDEILAKRLKGILLSNNPKMMVGIFRFYFYPFEIDPTKDLNQFHLEILPESRRVLIKNINWDKQYACTDIAYILNPKDKFSEKYFKKWRSIWNNRHVVTVCCKEAHNSYDYDLFDNVRTNNYVFVPNIDAFDKYDSILNEIKQYDKNTLILLMCGPTATVLVEDLVNSGYRALDLGHLAKSYDWYKKGIVGDNQSYTKFYNPDI